MIRREGRGSCSRLQCYNGIGDGLRLVLGSSGLGSNVGRDGARRTRERTVETDEGLLPKKALSSGKGNLTRGGEGKKGETKVRRRLDGGKKKEGDGMGRGSRRGWMGNKALPGP